MNDRNFKTRKELFDYLSNNQIKHQDGTIIKYTPDGRINNNDLLKIVNSDLSEFNKITHRQILVKDSENKLHIIDILSTDASTYIPVDIFEIDYFITLYDIAFQSPLELMKALTTDKMYIYEEDCEKISCNPVDGKLYSNDGVEYISDYILECFDTYYPPTYTLNDTSILVDNDGNLLIHDSENSDKIYDFKFHRPLKRQELENLIFK